MNREADPPLLVPLLNRDPVVLVLLLNLGLPIPLLVSVELLRENGARLFWLLLVLLLLLLVTLLKLLKNTNINTKCNQTRKKDVIII